MKEQDTSTRLPKLVVNGRFLEKRMFGIGRYAEELTEALYQRMGEALAVLAPSRIAPVQEGLARRVAAHRVGRLSAHLWEQWELPVALRKLGRPLLVNFVNTAPVLYRNQVTVVHDLSHVRHSESFTRSYRLAYSALVPAALRYSRRVIANSEFTKRELVEVFDVDPSRLDVVYPFVPSNFLRLVRDVEPEARSPYVLAVSSLNPRKNFRNLLRAFAQLSDLDLRLVVVGSKGHVFRDDRLRELAGDRVDLVGQVTDERLVALYKGASAFAYPSLYEGFGIPPLEAMTCGCPVVAAAAASLPEACGDAAYYVDPRDPASIANGIRQLVAAPELARALAARGLQHAARFSLENSAEALTRVLLPLLS